MQLLLIQQHGTSHVSIYDENYIQLGSWVKRQRAEYKKYMSKGRAKSQMTKERIDKLESIGFQWRLKPDKITWDDRFEVSFFNTGCMCVATIGSNASAF
jgi:hypothetical protein